MPEAQRRPRYRNELGNWDRRIPFRNTTDALHGTTGGLTQNGCDNDLNYTRREDNPGSPCNISGTDYSGI